MKEPRAIRIYDGKLESIRTKNALAIGFKGRSSYIVTLEKDEEGKNKMKIHTYVTDTNRVIEYVDNDFVDSYFKTLTFF